MEIDREVVVEILRKIDQIVVFFYGGLSYTGVNIYTNVLFQITKAPNFIQHHKSRGRRCETFLKNIRR